MTATFQELLAASYPRVHRCTLGMLGDEQEAREVAQEALLKAWRARDSYDPSRPFYPWLYTIVRNSCRDVRARRYHRPFVGVDTERVASSAPSPLSVVDSHEAQERVRAALEKLHPDHREIIAMRHFQDLSYTEIGELLGVPQGTVMSRLFRARKALVRILEEAE
jgi:RNA polymerase sigma-70 factor (ECF subfamily)